MSTVYGLRSGQNGTQNINIMLPTNGTPVNAIASQGTLTLDTQPIVGDTMTIGTTTYIFTTDGTAASAGEIDVGADLPDAKTLVVAAINGTDGNNDPHPLVSAVAFAVNDCVITALIKGVVGDTIATTETFDAATNVFDDVVIGTTTAGVDGTTGIAGESLIDDDYVYRLLSDNDTSDTNWVRTAHATF